MLRTFLRLSVLLLIVAFGVVTSPKPAGAIFHLAAISEVMSGYQGNPDVQYMEIRMEVPGQHIVHDTLLSVFSEDPLDPVLNVLLILPNDVTNQGANVRWLMGTQEFANVTGLTPDFIFPPGFLTPKGMICWGAPDFAPPPDQWPIDDPNTPNIEEGWYVPALYTDCVSYGGYVGDAPLCRLLEPPCSTHPPATLLPPGDGALALTRLLPAPPVPLGTTGIGAFENHCAPPLAPALSAQHLMAPPDADAFTLCCPTPENNAGQFALLGPDGDSDGLPDCHEGEIGTTTGMVDTDQDGCADGEEVGQNKTLGGARDPANFWDFYDTPDAGNARDKIIAVADIFRIVGRFGTNGTATTVGDALSPPPASGYHAAFDRSPKAGKLSGPADGIISTGDILLSVLQFVHTCSAAP